MTAKDSCIVTGASGFIGQHLTRALNKQGYRVIGTGRGKDPPEEIAGVLSNWISCDFSGTNAANHIARKTGEVEYLFHLAATVRDTHDISEIQNLYQADIITPVQLADQLKRTLRHICFFSSIAAYSLNGKEVSEDTPVQPGGLYGTNKVVLEDSLDLISRQHGIPLSILRISSVYGPGMPSGKAIPRFISDLKEGNRPKINGDPEAKRDYIYVEDLPVVAVAAIKRDISGVYNIASGTPKGLLEIGRLLGEMMEIPFQPKIQRIIEGKDYLISIEKARQELGFSPTPLETGLKRTIESMT